MTIDKIRLVHCDTRKTKKYTQTKQGNNLGDLETAVLKSHREQRSRAIYFHLIKKVKKILLELFA